MARPVRIDPDIGGKFGPRHLDEAIAELARRQHGVVSRAQLLALGLGSRAIDHRRECGRLHSLYSGAYAVGHRAVSWKGRCLAAALAIGEGAVISHRTAAGLWDIRRTASALLEVTFERNVERPGLNSHRAALPPDEITTVDAIPITTPHRTLLDLAATLDEGQLRRALERTEALRLPDPLPLAALLERYPGRNGTPALRTAIQDGIVPSTTRSELEDRFLTLLDAHGLPRPEVNVLVAGFEVDCYWREAGLVVELDGHETHGTREAFERDRARDRVLQATGERVVRVTWRQVHEDAAGLAASLARLLYARFALRG